MTTSDKKYWVLLVTFLAIWGVTFFDSIAGMVEIWTRSETFTHGFIIFPLALWLIYSKRDELKGIPVSPSYLAIFPFVGAAALWLLALAADIDIVAQLMTVSCLVLGVWLVSGWQVVKRILFPLSYLFFAVPAGENLVPALQDVTAWITVKALNIHGIPVFRDGLYLHLPSGLFEVAAACSGIRYLIASVAIGTLYAYLTYRTQWKRAAFIVFAILLPILANGIRAYLIVIIAHYSNMEYATGADHLVYGWVFFGFVMLLMMYIGGLFAEPQAENEGEAERVPVVVGSGRVIPLVAGFVVLITVFLGQYSLVRILPPQTPGVALSAGAGSVYGNTTYWQINFKRPILSSVVTLSDGTEMFRAVYANSQQEGELVSTANKLYDEKLWTLVKRSQVETPHGRAVYLYLTNTLGRKRGIVFWYKLDGEQITNRAEMKLKQAVQAIRGENAYAEINAVSMVSEESAETMLSKLLAHTGQFEAMSVEVKSSRD